MKIRLATIKDIIKIKSIVKKIDTRNFHFSNEDIIKKHIEKKHYYLALENNKCLGVIGLVPAAGSYEIYSLVSNRPGVGKELVRFAEKKCRREKINKLWCWSLKRYKAKDFYLKMGFN
ncbi:MAG: GNAT family N-acetyltransferase, partial [Patescibacteria group bacterium]|nr:GNAT family N-acetyltransferase [Patescibacteria group bacterium]